MSKLFALAPALVLGLALALLCGRAAAQPPPAPTTAALTLAGSIALPGVANRIGAAKFDKLALAGGLLFVAVKENGTLAVVDTAAGAFVASIEGLEEPQGVEVVAALGLVLVATAGDGLLHGFAAAAPFAEAFPPLTVGLDADNVKCEKEPSAGGGIECWVAHGGGGAPAGMAHVRVSAGSLEWLGDTPFPAHPEEHQLAPRALSSLMYVSCPDDNSNVLVFDRAKRSVVASWPLLLSGASGPFANALDAAGLRLFVATQDNDGLAAAPRFLVLNVLDGSVVFSMDTVAVCDNVVYDVDARLIYVACGGTTGSVGSTLYVIQQGASADEYTPLGVAQGMPAGLAIARTAVFDPVTALLYLGVPFNDDISPAQPAAVLVFRRTLPPVAPAAAAAAGCAAGSLPPAVVGGLTIGVALVCLAAGAALGRLRACGGAPKVESGDEAGAYSLA